MSTTNPKNLKITLSDIAKDLDVTERITETYNVFNHDWTFTLLNEEESNWRMSNVNMSNKLSAVTSFRLPTLAIGIRQIDGVPVFEYFSDEWKELPEDTRRELERMNSYARKYFVAEHLMKFLADRFPEGLAELYDKWQLLESRRLEAIATLKKSSGESSEQEQMEQNTTELSPIGVEK